MTDNKKAQQQRDLAAYNTALDKLRAYRCDSPDDPTYLRLSAAAARAEQKVAWWKRWH